MGCDKVVSSLNLSTRFGSVWQIRLINLNKKCNIFNCGWVREIKHLNLRSGWMGSVVKGSDHQVWGLGLYVKVSQYRRKEQTTLSSPGAMVWIHRQCT